MWPLAFGCWSMSRLEEAARRLERAVARLEGAVGHMAAGDSPRLTTARDDYPSLADATATVAQRLDAAIERLDRALEG